MSFLHAVRGGQNNRTHPFCAISFVCVWDCRAAFPPKLACLHCFFFFKASQRAKICLLIPFPLPAGTNAPETGKKTSSSKHKQAAGSMEASDDVMITIITCYVMIAGLYILLQYPYLRITTGC